MSTYDIGQLDRNQLIFRKSKAERQQAACTCRACRREQPIWYGAATAQLVGIFISTHNIGQRKKFAG